MKNKIPDFFIITILFVFFCSTSVYAIDDEWTNENGETILYKNEKVYEPGGGYKTYGFCTDSDNYIKVYFENKGEDTCTVVLEQRGPFGWESLGSFNVPAGQSNYMIFGGETKLDNVEQTDSTLYKVAEISKMNQNNCYRVRIYDYDTNGHDTEGSLVVRSIKN